MAVSSIQSTDRRITRQAAKLARAIRLSFLNLPGEVRLMIFEYLLRAQFIHIFDGGGLEKKIIIRHSKEWSANLLLTCKVIADEVKLLSQPKNLFTEFPMSSCLECLSTDLISSVKSVTIESKHFMDTSHEVWENFKSLEEIYVTYDIPCNFSSSMLEGKLSNKECDHILFLNSETFYLAWDRFMSQACLYLVLPVLQNIGIKLYYAGHHYVGEIAKSWPPDAKIPPFLVVIISARSKVVRYRIERRSETSRCVWNRDLSKAKPWTPYESDTTYLRHPHPYPPIPPHLLGPSPVSPSLSAL